MINLDKAALNSPHPRFELSIKNAISMHRPTRHGAGLESAEFLLDCKRRIARHLRKEPVDLSFFGSATAAIRFLAAKLKNKYRICCGASEHSCSLAVADRVLPVDSAGQISELDIGSGDLLIVSLRNNETGITLSGESRDKILAAVTRGALLVIDATGGDWSDTIIDASHYVFASSGKWCSLPGLGILLGTEMLWDDQNTEGMGGVIGGSPNLVGISCLADSMDWLSSDHGRTALKRVNQYADVFDSAAAGLGWIKNGSGSGISNYFIDLPSELFVQIAAENGLTISAGSACNSGLDSGSHVIRAMYDDHRSRSSIRVSWDALTKENDILAAAEIVKKVDAMLRA